MRDHPVEHAVSLENKAASYEFITAPIDLSPASFLYVTRLACANYQFKRTPPSVRHGKATS